MTVQLFNFGAIGRLFDPSPFCCMLEAYLRVAGIDYEVKNFQPSHFKLAPKGLLPFVRLENGELIGDSELVIDHFIAGGAYDPNEKLNDIQKAEARAMIRMLNEHVYWGLLFGRWQQDKGWALLKKFFFGDIPWPLQNFIANKQRNWQISKLRFQGMGRHSFAEVVEFVRKDFNALSVKLGVDEYMFGSDKPTLVDLTLHSYTSSFVYFPLEDEMTDALKEYPNLLEHMERVQVYLEELVS